MENTSIENQLSIISQIFLITDIYHVPTSLIRTAETTIFASIDFKNWPIRPTDKKILQRKRQLDMNLNKVLLVEDSSDIYKAAFKL